MNLLPVRGVAAMAVCATAILGLSACSGDGNDGESESPATAASSSETSSPETTSASATPADLDVPVLDLMLPKSEFPAQGEYTVLDKAAIDADKSPDPTVVPASCQDLGDDDDTEGFDRARVDFELPNGSSIKTEVTMGIGETFEAIDQQIKDCPAVTLRTTLENGSEMVAEMKNTLEAVTGSTVPAKTIISTGTATVGDQSLPMTIRSTGALVEGTTVGVEFVLVGDAAKLWDEDDQAYALGLLNKQIAVVQEAAAS